MRTPGGRVLISTTAAATLLGACVAPVPLSVAERHSSMAATTATVGVSCPEAAERDPKFDRPIEPAHPDQQLLAEALQQLVNAERCRQGAAPLALLDAGIRAASEHARTMAELDFMAHTSPVAGRETLQRRLDAEDISYRWAAENVARSAASSLSNRGEGCLRGGAPLSHGDVAEGLFAMWMGSSGHRSNILGPNFRAFGAGIGVNPGKYSCGEITSATVFTG